MLNEIAFKIKDVVIGNSDIAKTFYENTKHLEMHYESNPNIESINRQSVMSFIHRNTKQYTDILRGELYYYLHDLSFLEVTGQDICKYYTTGFVYSCMADRPCRLQLYINNPDVFKLAVCESKIGSIKARAMLYKDITNTWYYSHSYGHRHALNTYLQKYTKILCHLNSKLQIPAQNLEHLPYLDNFCYFRKAKKHYYFYNQFKPGTHRAKNP